MTHQWQIKPPASKKDTQPLQQLLGVDAIMAQHLVRQGIRTLDHAKEWFRPHWGQLHSPFLMKDMDKAVARIQHAISTQERIMVYGDYDVDGTTAVVCMFEALRTVTPHLVHYQPDRYAEGYGLSKMGIDTAHHGCIGLMVVLDCGIKSVDMIDYAQTLGIDVIVCDHHMPPEILPKAHAILNPKQIDCPYPFKELSGCGVGFKLIQALEQKGLLPNQTAHQCLDLTALSIAADLVSMTGENRTLAALGLESIRRGDRPSIRHMLGNVTPESITIEKLVFGIAPKINAAGRIFHAQKAVELLLETQTESLSTLLYEIEQYNQTRKQLDQSMHAQALQELNELEPDNNMATIVSNEHWHKGVLGIVASRLIESRYQPTIVLGQGKNPDEWVGSARSVEGFDIYAALCQCESHMYQFGGHFYAAGLTLPKNRLEAFKTQFKNIVRQSPLWPFTPKIHVDAQLTLDTLTPKHQRILAQLAPFGPDHMHPIYQANGVCVVRAQCMGSDGSHLRMVLRQNGVEFNAVAFGMGHAMPLEGALIDVVFQCTQNHWNDAVSPQLQIKDFVGSLS